MTRTLSAIVLVLVALVAVSCGLKNPLAPDVPIVTLFTAEPFTVKLGTPTTLRWDVSDGDAEVRIDPGVGNVPTTGSAVLTPVVTTTFTLNARNRGGSVQRVLTVVVTP
jgi:hypothetical protein